MRHPASRLLALLAVAVLAAGCGDDGSGEAAEGTSTSATGSSTTTTTTEAVTGESCLEGVWAVDVDSYVDGFSGYLERVGGPTLGELSGSLTLTMDGERFVALWEDWTVVLVLPGGAGETTVITDGDQAGDYTGSDETLTVTDIESTLDTTGTIVIGGVETDLSAAPIDLDAFFESNLFATPVPFACDDDVLTLDTVVPEFSEQFSTDLDRVS